MPNKTNLSRRNFRHATVQAPRPRALSAHSLGFGCLILAAACIGMTFSEVALTVQSGATLLGVTLAASGVISLLAGDQ